MRSSSFRIRSQNLICTTLREVIACFVATKLSQIWEDEGLDCFKSSDFGSSPDLNPAENVGAIMKDGVEDVLLCASERGTKLF